MFKALLASVAATAMLTGVALAQTTTIITPAPPPAAPTDNTTIRATIGPDGKIDASATQQGIAGDGQVVTEKRSFQNGPDGTTESHSQTQIDPATGNTVTRSTTSTTR
jgi:hypothetical protein